MAKRNIEAEVEAVGALRDISPENAARAIARCFGSTVSISSRRRPRRFRANCNCVELIPDLLGAFDRLFVKPVERDPQCWAKNAIAQALMDLDYREHAPFLMGARHVQLEAVWNGQEDTAQTLRGICLLALVSCNDIPRARDLPRSGGRDGGQGAGGAGGSRPRGCGNGGRGGVASVAAESADGRQRTGGDGSGVRFAAAFGTGAGAAAGEGLSREWSGRS